MNRVAKSDRNSYHLSGLDASRQPRAAEAPWLPAFPKETVSEKVKIETRAPTGQWLHIVATHGDGEVALYINGEPVGQASYDPSTPGFEFFAYTWQYHVGCWYGQKMHYRGDIGPIRLYTDALSAPEVAERFRSGWPTAK